MAKPKPAPLPAGCEVGGYRIVRFMASGGSSLVYQAQAATGEAVLLKEFLPAALMHRPAGQFEPMIRPGAVDRVRRGLQAFLDSARNLAVLQHAAVACVIDCVQAHETVYLVSPYLEGHTLQAHVVAARQWAGRRLACLSESSVISLGLDLLQALEVVHEAGLLHLDIKPSNVLMTLDGGLVLLDFDAAQPLTEAHVATLADVQVRPAFTPGFSAPETMASESLQGPWTDLYAVGACLYACMSGHPPQDCKSRAQSDSVPESLQGLVSVYTAGLCAAVQRALALDAAVRPQQVAHLRAELLQAAQSRPMHAQPCEPPLQH